MDPVPILATMAMSTKNLGLAATISTTYYNAFHIARTMMTLDHMTGGRAGWNVVTSLNDSEAFNMGAAGTIEHDRRYDRADELMTNIIDMWGAWDSDAILFDKENGVFADPEKVRSYDFQGEWFQTRGTFTVPPSPQGHPVIVQAGQSGRGRQFACEWGEVIFTIQNNVDGVFRYAMRCAKKRRNRGVTPTRLRFVQRFMLPRAKHKRLLKINMLM